MRELMCVYVHDDPRPPASVLLGPSIRQDLNAAQRGREGSLTTIRAHPRAHSAATVAILPAARTAPTIARTTRRCTSTVAREMPSNELHHLQDERRRLSSRWR